MAVPLILLISILPLRTFSRIRLTSVQTRIRVTYVYAGLRHNA